VAFPVVAATNESATTSAGTSHVVSLPAGGGGLLVVLMNKGAGVATINALAGWNELVDENLANGMFVAWSDTETGATATFTSSANTRDATISYRIGGALPGSVQAPELSTVATGSSVNPDATTCTPTGGAKDYLWITFFGMAGEQADDDTLVTTTPTNYNSTLVKTCGVAGTNLGGLVASAHRTNNAASEDAGQWVSVDNAAWRAYTLAIHPALPIPPVTMSPRLAI
jgi:hypothetical protein